MFRRSSFLLALQGNSSAFLSSLLPIGFILHVNTHFIVCLWVKPPNRSELSLFSSSHLSTLPLLSVFSCVCFLPLCHQFISLLFPQVKEFASLLKPSLSLAIPDMLFLSSNSHQRMCDYRIIIKAIILC